MKLSEIVTYFTFERDVNMGAYLIFIKNGMKLSISFGDFPVQEENYFNYVAIDPEKVNLKYLYYYLSANKVRDQNILDIEIPELPSIEVQNKLVPFIAKLYEFNVAKIKHKMSKLFTKNRNYILYNNTLGEARKYNECLYRITDKEMFFRSLSKGEFGKYEYVDIIRTDIIDEEFLMYSLHYYYNGMIKNDKDYFNILLSDISEQKQIINTMRVTHSEILRLNAKRRWYKSEIRTLINNVGDC